jgi:hypothetical protein
MKRLLISLALVLSALHAAQAKPLATRGRLLLSEDFLGERTYTKEFSPLAPGWRVRAWHADWIPGKEGLQSKWTSGHMPVLALEGNAGDVVIELEFRFRKEAGKKAVCRLSALNPSLAPRGYTVSAWANVDSRERPLGLSLEDDEWKPAKGFTTHARADLALEPDCWYTLCLEVIGDKAQVSCNGVVISAQHSKFSLPKTLFTIGTGLSPHEIRRVRIYEASLSPE